ncbi:MAG: glycosyl transferase family 28 [Gammaproteobacteria bacterium]|nr:glycosyl transferase family 28 [Gammaproteobacteria bacterium]
MRIHIYVQHLLGGGHLARMQVLAAALARGGHQVTLISGGFPPHTLRRAARNYQLFQLPPVKTAPGDFTKLLRADGAPISAGFRAERAMRLLQCVKNGAPDALVVESFPFGRAALRFELLPLMRLAARMRPRPLMLCSLRDILQARAPAKQRRSLDEAKKWFDAVLVHADPAVANLAESFPLAAELSEKIFYTGYLHAGPGEMQEEKKHDAGEKTGEVVVSAGGGAVGFKLLQTALAAREKSALKKNVWRLLVGANAPRKELEELKKLRGNFIGGSEEDIIIERSRADFRALLRRCAVSVSQAGYNTVLDLAAARCRAVLAPFARFGETEQTRRAEIFARLGRAVLLAENDLTPARLAAAIDRAVQLDMSGCARIKMDGARQSARFIERQFRRTFRARQARRGMPR